MFSEPTACKIGDLNLCKLWADEGNIKFEEIVDNDDCLGMLKLYACTDATMTNKRPNISWKLMPYKAQQTRK